MQRQPLHRPRVAFQDRADPAHALQPGDFGGGGLGFGVPLPPLCLQRVPFVLLARPFLGPQRRCPDPPARVLKLIERLVEWARRDLALRRQLVALLFQPLFQKSRLADAARGGQQGAGDIAIGFQQRLAAAAQSFGIQNEQPFQERAVAAAEDAVQESGIDQLVVVIDDGVAAGFPAAENEPRPVAPSDVRRHPHARIAKAEAHRGLIADTKQQIGDSGAQHGFSRAVRRQQHVHGAGPWVE